MRSFIKRIIYREKYNSDTYVKFLRLKGCSIGSGTVFFTPSRVMVDITRPYLIEIGNDVKITSGVTILTHDFSWSVLHGAYGDVLGSSGKVMIKDNVFIGMNSTILSGVTIESNVIVGANSVVSSDLPSNAVYAGVPAKKIMTLDQYHQKRKARQLGEAAELVRCYKKAFGKNPPEEELAEFFWLFQPRNRELPQYFIQKMLDGGAFEGGMDAFLKTEPAYNGYTDFLSAVSRENNEEE